MVALRSRRLEELFGGLLGEVTADQVRAVAAAGVREDADLDFKAKMYAARDTGKQLCKDVAAMANTAGGVILIGVTDAGDRAGDAPGVPLAGGEEPSMRQAVASGVFPPPVFDVVSVDDPDATAEHREPWGFLLVAVPRSPYAPHALQYDHRRWAYPRRDGSTTGWMAEPDIAAAYRRRLAGAHAQEDRLEQVAAEAAARLDLAAVWLLLAAAPSLPGDLLLTPEALASFRQAALGRQPQDYPAFGQYSRVGVGRRRLLADAGGQPYARTAYGVSFEGHTDGAAAAALQLNLLTSRADGPAGPTSAGDGAVSDELVAAGILCGLQQLAEHAQRAAAGGQLLVQTRLHTPAAVTSLSLANYRNSLRQIQGRALACPALLPLAEAVAELDALVPAGPDLVATAAALGDEVAQSLGFAGLTQLTRDGRIDLRSWRSQDGYRHALRSWATRHGVEVGDDPR